MWPRGMGRMERQTRSGDLAVYLDSMSSEKVDVEQEDAGTIRHYLQHIPLAGVRGHVERPDVDFRR